MMSTAELVQLKKHFRMHNQFLLVRSLSNAGETKGGIYLPVEKDADAQTSRCEVLLVADDCKLGFKPGDIVFFSKLVPDDVMISLSEEEGGDTELWFVKETDIKMSEPK